MKPTPADQDQCPSEDALRRLLDGKLPAAVVEKAALHVEMCGDCQQQLELLTSPVADDSLSKNQGRLWNQVLAGSDQNSQAQRLTPPPSSLETAHRNSRLNLKNVEDDLPDLPGYEVLQKIASGGMGVVYRARQTGLARDVAIKFMRRSRDPSAVARFQREMKAAGQLNDIHIVRAFDASDVDGLPYLVMELLDGKTLRRIIRDLNKNGLALSVGIGCEIIRQAALGLSAAHAAGMIHRDVKPSNLMVTQGGVVKLLDLGLVSIRHGTGFSDSIEEHITDEVTILGSTDFISPEQGIQSRSVTFQSDIYSLGCTFFATLAGRPPFSGSSYPTASSKLLAHATEPRPDVRHWRPDVPAGLAEVLQQMMEIDPAERPASLEEVVELIAPFASSVSAFPFNWEDAGVSVSQPVETGVIPTRDESKKLWWVAVGGIVSALLAVLAVVWHFGTQDNNPRQDEQAAELASGKDPVTPAAETTPKSAPRDRLPIVQTGLDPAEEFKTDDITSIPPAALKVRLSRQMFDGEIYWLSYSDDGSILYLTGPGDSVRALDSTTGRDMRFYQGHKTESRSLVFSEDRSLMYSTDDVGQILEHNVQSAELQRVVADLYDSIRELDLSADQKLLAALVENNDGMFLVDVATGEHRKFDGDYQNCRFDSTGKYLYYSQRGIGLARLNVSTNEKEIVVPDSSPRFGFLSGRPDLDLAIYIKPPGRVSMIDMANGIALDTPFKTPNSDRHRGAISPSGKLLVIGPRSDTATFVRPESGVIEAALTIPDSGSFRVFSFSPDGSSLALGMNEGRLVIVDLQDETLDLAKRR